MRAKNFFYACAGILLLVIAFTIGAATGHSQVSGDSIIGIAGVGSRDGVFVITANGRIWEFLRNPNTWTEYEPFPGSPLPVEGTTMGDIKKKYRDDDEE